MVETVLGMTDLQIKLFTALGQIGVAVAVAVIAWLQLRTARNKLKSDLFDRRYSAYKEIVAKVRVVGSAQQIDTADELLAHALEIDRIAKEMAWLFDDRIAAAAGLVYDAALKLIGAQHVFVAAPNDDERARALHVVREVFMALHNQLDELTKLIKPLMQLKH